MESEREGRRNQETEKIVGFFVYLDWNVDFVNWELRKEKQKAKGKT